MSSKSYVPEVFVLPEDDANREMALGFETMIGNPRTWRILAPAGGWRKALDAIPFQRLETHRKRRLVVLMDFDDAVPLRKREIGRKIPAAVHERVFVLGVRTEPEELQAALGHCSREAIGREIGMACRDGKISGLWSLPLLEHNQREWERLMQDVRPILFAS